MHKTFFYCVPVAALMIILLTTCTKEPTIGQIQASVDGYRVAFSIEATHADSYLWDFGDSQTSTEASPVHEYAASGTFIVNLTVTGKGGESKATTQIEISPSLTELLTGGMSSSSGKTWVLSRGFTEGMNGGGAIDSSLTVFLPSVENMLDVIGLGEEYDNEYTFYADGRYRVDVKNGIALISSIYGLTSGTIVDYGNESNNLGIYGGTFTSPASSTWSLHLEDLVVDAITNPMGTEVPALHEMKTFKGKKWISLSDGAFFGVLDFPSTRQFIIKEITAEKMEVAIFICAYFADESAWTIPEYLFHLTFIPKQ